MHSYIAMVNQGVLLDANENSIGPAVLTPSNHLVLNRYPDPLHLDVKEKVRGL